MDPLLEASPAAGASPTEGTYKKALSLLGALTALVIAITSFLAATTDAFKPIFSRITGEPTELQLRVKSIEGVLESRQKDGELLDKLKQDSMLMEERVRLFMEDRGRILDALRDMDQKLRIQDSLIREHDQDQRVSEEKYRTLEDKYRDLDYKYKSLESKYERNINQSNALQNLIPRPN